MKVKDLRGKECNWNLSGCIPRGDDKRPRSKLHVRAREVLRGIFPADPRLEEVKIPNSRLRLDFFIPRQTLAVEVQGQQHSKYNPFFHGNKMSFLQSCGRDNRKAEWCEANGIMLVEFPYDESDEQWRRSILQACGGDTQGS